MERGFSKGQRARKVWVMLTGTWKPLTAPVEIILPPGWSSPTFNGLMPPEGALTKFRGKTTRLAGGKPPRDARGLRIQVFPGTPLGSLAGESTQLDPVGAREVPASKPRGPRIKKYRAGG